MAAGREALEEGGPFSHRATRRALQREGQALVAEPEPDAAHRAELGKAREDGADGGADRGIGMEAHLTVGLAPDKADRETTAQFAARGLVADAAEKARPQEVQLGLAHGALQAKQEPIIEEPRVIDAIGIADEGIGETAEIQQTVPIGVVAGEAGELEAEDDADMAQRGLRGGPGGGPG